MIIETSQVTLAIVDEKYEHVIPELDQTITGKQIHKQLVDNRVWKNDKDGKYVSLMFDSKEFQFRPTRVINGQTVKATQFTVGKSVADALLSSSIIVVGDKKDFLNAPAVHFLQVLESHEMGVERPRVSSPTTCGICDKDMQTLPRLTRHYEKHKKTHPELFEKTSAFEKEEDTEEVEA